MFLATSHSNNNMTSNLIKNLFIWDLWLRILIKLLFKFILWQILNMENLVFPIVLQYKIESRELICIDTQIEAMKNIFYNDETDNINFEI